MPSTQRRRSATRKGRPVLTRTGIAAKALEIAGAQGFPAVTMRTLSAELGVTVRALYNYVDDRAEVIDLAVEAMLAEWEVPDLESGNWEESVAAYAAGMRALYRRHPRALLVSLDETASPAAIHPNRLMNPDRFLGLLRAIGLTPVAAIATHRQLSLLLFSFALLVDYPADREGRTLIDSSPVPATWLDAHADLPLPHLTEAAQAAPTSVDAQFDELVATVVGRVRSQLPS
ncbi:TetR/AcrR family transcriptional regulator [Nocardia sp. NPDC059180]|uniref:TetR/AcrR family transcriptional regulator n=1 Tax=Nocardia sp. NPDC059180 TaxID=3346761 RepID=UPI003676E243